MTVADSRRVMPQRKNTSRYRTQSPTTLPFFFSFSVFAYLNISAESPLLPPSPLVLTPRSRTFAVPRSIRLPRQPLPSAVSLLDPATNDPQLLGNSLVNPIIVPGFPVPSPQLPDSTSAEILILPWLLLPMEGLLFFSLVGLRLAFPFVLPSGRSRSVPSLLRNCLDPPSHWSCSSRAGKRGRWSSHDTTLSLDPRSYWFPPR